jgi:hypothetical protein
MSPNRQRAQRLAIILALIAATVGSIILTAWLYRSALPPGYTQAAAIFVALGSGVLMGLALADHLARRRSASDYQAGYTVGYRHARDEAAGQTTKTEAERAAEMRKIIEDLNNVTR